MQQPDFKRGMARSGVAWTAALVLALGSYAVAAESNGQQSKRAGAARSVDVGEILYGEGGGAWGSPSRTAARLARQRDIKEDATRLNAAQSERGRALSLPAAGKPALVLPLRPAGNPALELPLAPLLKTSEDAGQMAQWLIPLGSGILIGLGVTGIYCWNRSRGMMGSASRRMGVFSVGAVTSVASVVTVLPSDSPLHMGAIPKPTRRHGSRSSRSGQFRMISFPGRRISPSRDLQGDAVRQLQTLGILPVQVGEMTPGTGRPYWITAGGNDDVQMYNSVSDPIPNYAYLEDAPRMRAQVEHQNAAVAMVWSNQSWHR